MSENRMAVLDHGEANNRILGAYFIDRGRLFQSDRGRRFNVIVDAVSL